MIYNNNYKILDKFNKKYYILKNRIGYYKIIIKE